MTNKPTLEQARALLAEIHAYTADDWAGMDRTTRDKIMFAAGRFSEQIQAAGETDGEEAKAK